MESRDSLETIIIEDNISVWRLLARHQTTPWLALTQWIHKVAHKSQLPVIGLANALYFGFIFTIINHSRNLRDIGLTFSISFFFSAFVILLGGVPWKIRLSLRPNPSTGYILAVNGFLCVIMGYMCFFISMFVPFALFLGWDTAVAQIVYILRYSVWGLAFSGATIFMTMDEMAAQTQIDREKKLEALAEGARMAALRSQMNPHFFFNALNTVAALIPKRPDEAERAVELLAETLRPVLMGDQPEIVPIEAEIKLARAYAQIEHLRFGEHLDIQFHIEDDAAACLMPSLCLQPLLENAIRHGASRTIERFNVVVSVRLEGDLAAIKITGAPHKRLNALDENQMITAPITAGHALHNIAQRIEYIYNGDAKFEVLIDYENGSIVNLELPATERQTGRG